MRCKKKEINGLNCMERAQGCVFCGATFVVGDEDNTLSKRKLPLIVKFIYFFLENKYLSL